MTLGLSRVPPLPLPQEAQKMFALSLSLSGSLPNIEYSFLFISFLPSSRHHFFFRFCTQQTWSADSAYVVFGVTCMELKASFFPKKIENMKVPTTDNRVNYGQTTCAYLVVSGWVTVWMINTTLQPENEGLKVGIAVKNGWSTTSWVHVLLLKFLFCMLFE